MEQIKVSIIVPIYGIEAYLAQCVESIINQTYKNLEIILVDDGSKDNCPAICDDYKSKDSRIQVIHKPNGGLVSARKAGIKIATGEYVCHVDGDDWLKDNYIERFIEIVDKYSPDIVCSGEIRSYPNKDVVSPLREREGFYTREQIITDILPSLLERADGYYLNHANQQKCVKRELAIESLMTVNDAISMSEDHACTSVAMTRANSMYLLKDCLYYYRITSSSMTGAKKPLSWAYPRNLAYHFSHHLDLSLADLNEQFNRAISHFLFNAAVSQFYGNKSYAKTCQDIERNLTDFDSVINGAHFSKIDRKLMVTALRYRWFLFLKVYSLIKQVS